MARRIEPLQFFPDEKLASDPADFDAEPIELPEPGSGKEIDPGERAFVGLTAASSSLATKLVPFITRMAVNPIYESDSTAWTLPRVRGATSFSDAGYKAIESKPQRPSKVLGLFRATERPQPSFKAVYEAAGAQSLEDMAGGIITSRELEAKLRAGKIPAAGIDEAKELLEGLKPVVRAGEPIARLDQVRDTVDSFIDKHHLKERGVRINLQGGPLSSIGGGRYDLATKEVTFPRVGKEIALHELGHAADYTTRIGRVRAVAEPILNKGVMVALPVALAAGDRIKEMFPGTVDDKVISFMQDNAPQIMGATLAATSLYPEAKASFLAIRHLRETEGPQAARAALKKLVPFFGTYLLGAVPAVVGMALARKYMRQAREEKAELRGTVSKELAELEKTSDILGGIKDVVHVGKEIGRSAVDLFVQPGRIKKVVSAAREVGTSPEFVMGALGSAIPATLGALYMYGTPQGKLIREPMVPEGRDSLLGHRRRDIAFASAPGESWREQHPLRFAGLVAMGAALSGGIMSKFLSDLGKVL